ncbi:hypothetical protein GCM10008983_17500 [Lentibacillus halophilus]|uniref:DUF3993 domain-containing protein n=1 Tax=Lentibacillus halophilus TaxID=295065 RepID=A0ABP3J6G2_9BACI
MRNRNYFQFIRISTGLAIILTLMLMQGAVHHPTSAEKENRTTNANVDKSLTHERIVALTGRFRDLLVPKIDETNKVVKYDTLDEFKKAFETVSTRKVASKYVDYYFYEQTDGLYVKPTETPPWFHEQEDYEMIRKNTEKVEISQTNQTDLYGTYTIKIEFTYDNQWKITGVSY